MIIRGLKNHGIFKYNLLCSLMGGNNQCHGSDFKNKNGP